MIIEDDMSAELHARDLALMVLYALQRQNMHRLHQQDPRVASITLNNNFCYMLDDRHGKPVHVDEENLRGIFKTTDLGDLATALEVYGVESLEDPMPDVIMAVVDFIKTMRNHSEIFMPLAQELFAYFDTELTEHERMLLLSSSTLANDT